MVSKRWMSVGFDVARDASARTAVAAIIQSVSDPLRRPDWLNKLADNTASSTIKGTVVGTTRAASRMAGAPSGPHKNSAQPMQLIPRNAPSTASRQALPSLAIPGPIHLSENWIFIKVSPAWTNAAPPWQIWSTFLLRQRSSWATPATHRGPLARHFVPLDTTARQLELRGVGLPTSTPASDGPFARVGELSRRPGNK